MGMDSAVCTHIRVLYRNTRAYVCFLVLALDVVTDLMNRFMRP